MYIYMYNVSRTRFREDREEDKEEREKLSCELGAKVFYHNGQPHEIVNSIIPELNALVFFEVTPHSYHQVAKVLTRDKSRLSINGWFRGPPLQQESCIFLEPYPDLVKCGQVDISEQVLRSWISKTYLEDDTQISIMEEFKVTSEINLPGFIVDGKYKEICQLLEESESIEWTLTGPANRRHYYALKEESAPEPVQQLLSVLRSEAMFLIVSNLSGIKLHPLAPDTSDSDNSSEEEGEEEEEDGDEDEGRPLPLAPLPNIKQVKTAKSRNPRLQIQLRKWTHGCYSLVHDHDPEVLDEEAKLDCILHFNHDHQTVRERGGFISYIAKDADEELLAVEPQSNHLSLIYRDKDTARFVKYLNASHNKTYYDISLVFHE